MGQDDHRPTEHCVAWSIPLVRSDRGVLSPFPEADTDQVKITKLKRLQRGATVRRSRSSTFSLLSATKYQFGLRGGSGVNSNQAIEVDLPGLCELVAVVEVEDEELGHGCVMADVPTSSPLLYAVVGASSTVCDARGSDEHDHGTGEAAEPFRPTWL